MNSSKQSRYSRRSGRNSDRTSGTRRQKFDFETMKAAATHKDPAVRKTAFTEYFERFAEFPSYLFDNEVKIDGILLETIRALLKDSATTKEMRKGIEALLARLPS